MNLTFEIPGDICKCEYDDFFWQFSYNIETRHTDIIVGCKLCNTKITYAGGKLRAAINVKNRKFRHKPVVKEKIDNLVVVNFKKKS